MLLAAVVAQLGWRVLLSPPAAVAPPPLPDVLAPLFAVSPPFGSPGMAAGAAAKADAPPVATLQGDLKLLGVFAGRDGAGQALFRVPDRGPVLVALGQEIAGGVKLSAVFADRVRVVDRGETRDILLRTTAAATKAAPTPAIAAARADRAGCVAPAGFAGSTYRINAELLSGMAAQPESWKPALDAARSGLTVRDAGGFAVMLGLKVGDLLREANGIALTATDDVLNAVVKPLQANQAVRVRGTRGGAELDFLLVNASACTGRGR